MSITAIGRNFNGDPNVVFIITDNTEAEIRSEGYWDLPGIVESVRLLQNGLWQWQPSDLVLIHYDDYVGFFTYDAQNACFVPLAASDTEGTIAFTGQLTTVGGNASEAFTVTGAVDASDLAFVQMVNQGPNTVSALHAVVTNNTLTVTFSGDPGAGAIFNYQLVRPVTA